MDNLTEYSRISTTLKVCLRKFDSKFQNSCSENFAESISEGNVSMGSFLLRGWISCHYMEKWRTDPSKKGVLYLFSSWILWAYWSYPRGITTDSKCPHRVRRVVLRTSFPNTRTGDIRISGPFLKKFFPCVCPINSSMRGRDNDF